MDRKTFITTLITGILLVTWFGHSLLNHYEETHAQGKGIPIIVTKDPSRENITVLEIGDNCVYILDYYGHAAIAAIHRKTTPGSYNRCQ